MKQITFWVLLGTLLLAQKTSVAKYKVYERVATNGGLFGYEKATSTPTEFVVSFNNELIIITGWSVKCNKPGAVECPKMGAEYLPVNPSYDWDQTQIETIDELVSYGLKQIQLNSNQGSKTIKIRVEGESFYRIYELNWDREKGLEVFRDNVVI